MNKAPLFLALIGVFFLASGAVLAAPVVTTAYSPTSNLYYGTSVTLAATGSDSTGVSNMRIYSGNPPGGSLVRECAFPGSPTGPYCSTSIILTSDYTFYVTATNKGGQTTTSATKTVPMIPSVCGNGVIEGAEQCEGSNLRSSTCASVGFASGTLSCSSSCTFDTSGCTSQCPAGQLYCSSACKDVQNDEYNCGACGVSCLYYNNGAFNGIGVCDAGTCKKITVTSQSSAETWQTGAQKTITWTSDLPASTQIIITMRRTDNYGYSILTTTNDGSEIVTVPTYLQQGTYYVELSANHNGNNLNDKSEGLVTVSTAPATDTTPPVISNPQPAYTLPAYTTQTTVSINTNEVATCKYSLNPGTSYNSMTTFTNTGGTYHSFLSGIANFNINFYVKCQDSSGNANQNDYTIAVLVQTVSQCQDGTQLDRCSANKPKYCFANGQLVDYCNQCGCPSGQTCNVQTGACLAANTSQPVRVITPNGGETFVQGPLNPIKWTGGSCPSTNPNCMIVTISKPADGTQFYYVAVWQKPDDVLNWDGRTVCKNFGNTGMSDCFDLFPGAGYKIKVWDSFTTDESDFTFTITSSTQTCTDTDGGINYYVKGTVTVTNFTNSSAGGSGSAASVTDLCSSSTTLTEFYCDQNKVAQSIYDCPNGCSNGACMQGAADLSSLPLPFTNNRGGDTIIVVGTHSSPADVVGALDVLARFGSDTGAPLFRVKLDVEITASDKINNNLILVGGPASNGLTAELAATGKTWTQQQWQSQGIGTSIVQLVENAFASGKTALIAAGYTAIDTRLATSAVQRYDDHNLFGTLAVFKNGVRVTTTA